VKTVRGGEKVDGKEFAKMKRKEYRRKNSEKLSLKSKERYQQNKDEYKEKSKAYYQKNKDKINEKRRVKKSEHGSKNAGDI